MISPCFHLSFPPFCPIRSCSEARQAQTIRNPTRRRFVATRITDASSVGSKIRSSASMEARFSLLRYTQLHFKNERGAIGTSERRDRSRHVRRGLALAFVIVSFGAPTGTAADSDTLQNVPMELSADKYDSESLGKLSRSSKTVPRCASKCVATCIRGGGGAPGLGPMSVRKAPVVFEEGFRSRSYCVRECTEICALQAKAKDAK